MPQAPATAVGLDVLSVVSLATGITSIVLGILAIGLSLYLYHKSNELMVNVIRALSEISASTKSTEHTNSQVTTRVIDVLAEQARSFTRVEQGAKLRAVERIESMPGVSRDQKRVLASEVAKGVEEVLTEIRSGIAPSAADYDWGPFIRRVDTIERTNRFISVKWLRERIFAGEPSFQEAIAVAIGRGILIPYQLENPKRPPFATSCCRLNREDEHCRAALATKVY